LNSIIKSATVFVLLPILWLSPLEATPAPRVQVLEGDKTGATLGQLRGTFQVRADQSQFDSSTNRTNLFGNVALTAKDENGRLFTLRAAKVRVQNGDLELQVEDKVFVPEWNSWVNSLRADGHIAGVPESALYRAVKQDPAFSAYRLHYSGVGAGAKTNGHVIWNRKTETLRTYSIFNYPQRGILDIIDVTFYNVDEARLISILDPKRADSTFREVKFSDLKKFKQFTDVSRRVRFSTQR
jgi:hypothetical protein